MKEYFSLDEWCLSKIVIIEIYKIPLNTVGF